MRRLYFTAPADASWLPASNARSIVFAVQFRGIYCGDIEQARDIGRAYGLSERAIEAILRGLIRIARHPTKRRAA